ncbi:hypothetical protein NDU88_012528, partial [Pleurodeles waltl]
GGGGAALSSSKACDIPSLTRCFFPPFWLIRHFLETPQACPRTPRSDPSALNGTPTNVSERMVPR